MLTLGFDANLLKLLSASVVAVFLAVPYWKSKYFAKPAAKKAQKEDAKNASFSIPIQTAAISSFHKD